MTDAASAVGGERGLRPAVFLDRDGTLIVERDYLADPDGVVLVDGAAGAVAALKRAGFAVVVVTNQSGIARGLYTEADYAAVAGRLDALLEREGAPVDGTYHCPHHPDYTGPCRCRKPGTGMYEEAIRRHGLDPLRSFYVGDRIKDVAPAAVLGGQGILVRTGYGRREEGGAGPEVWVVDDVSAAVDRILAGRSGVDPPWGPR